MKTRAIAHGTGVILYDPNGRRTGFNYDAPNQRREKCRTCSDSECNGSAFRAPRSALRHAVLPPDFQF